MISRKVLLLSLVVAVCAVAGYTGLGYGAGEAPPSTSPELVATYGDLATAILATKKAETGIVRAICAEAYYVAQTHMQRAANAAASDRAAAAALLERAATAVGMLAAEGDKAVAAVRNRLLEGGHHHHATPEIAKKYPPGFVLVKKTAQTAFSGFAVEIGKLAAQVKAGGAGAADIKAAAAKLSGLYREHTK
ncbi:MAG: hypothetical protein ACYS99_15020 [Planctomycetota bacterium]|jgi:hypothetical protein